jgi:Fe-S cluster assembly ATP-binding protein
MRSQIDGNILIISHQEKILNIADKIVVLANGNLQAYGDKEDILPTLMNGSGTCSTLASKIDM